MGKQLAAVGGALLNARSAAVLVSTQDSKERIEGLTKGGRLIGADDAYSDDADLARTLAGEE